MSHYKGRYRGARAVKNINNLTFRFPSLIFDYHFNQSIRRLCQTEPSQSFKKSKSKIRKDSEKVLGVQHPNPANRKHSFFEKIQKIFIFSVSCLFSYFHPFHNLVALSFRCSTTTSTMVMAVSSIGHFVSFFSDAREIAATLVGNPPS